MVELADTEASLTSTPAVKTPTGESRSHYSTDKQLGIAVRAGMVVDSGGVSLEQLCRVDGWQIEGKWVQGAERVGAGGELEVRVLRKGMKKSVADEEVLRLRRIRAEDEDTTSLLESVWAMRGGCESTSPIHVDGCGQRADASGNCR